MLSNAASNFAGSVHTPREAAEFELKPVFSTLPVGPGERRLALVVVLASAALFFTAVPFAKIPLPQVWAFIPAYQSALVVNDVITAVLLFGWERLRPIESVAFTDVVARLGIYWVIANRVPE